MKSIRSSFKKSKFTLNILKKFPLSFSFCHIFEAMASDASKIDRTWEDDTKMALLFAPFREKTLNPSSWNQKMTFWTQAILNECKKSNTALIDLQFLLNRFSRKGKTPHCLDVVVEEMQRCNKLKRVSETGKSPVKPKSSWLTWGYDTFLKTPVSWGIGYFSSGPSDTKNSKYVIVELLNNKCDRMIEQHYCGLYCDVTDSVIGYEELWKKSQSICDSETEFHLILDELVKQKKIIIQHENSKTLIKFVGREDKVVKPITKRDTEIYRIKTTRNMLMDRIDTLSADIERLKKEALRLKKTSKTQALRCMRQKKIIENRIMKLTGSLDILENILDQISHSASDDMVVKALESGNSVLKGLTDKTSVDHIADVMDELAEVLEQHSEIQDQLSSGPSGLDISREELEAELEEIMKGEQVKGDNSGLLIDDLISGLTDLHLPTVPTSPLSDKTSPKGQHTPGQSETNQPTEKSSTSPHDRLATPPGVSLSSQNDIYQQSPASVKDFDLSLELPDVPTFKPSPQKKDMLHDS